MSVRQSQGLLRTQGVKSQAKHADKPAGNCLALAGVRRSPGGPAAHRPVPHLLQPWPPQQPLGISTQPLQDPEGLFRTGPQAGMIERKLMQQRIGKDEESKASVIAFQQQQRAELQKKREVRRAAAAGEGACWLGATSRSGFGTGLLAALVSWSEVPFLHTP